MGNKSSDYIVATYGLVDVETRLKKRAEGIAVGLTVGSWTDLPASRQAAMKPFCGVVEGIQVKRDVGDGNVYAEVSVGYPVANLTPSIPAILTTVFGKLSMDGRIRLIELTLPDAFTRAFPGPKFGVSGVRGRAQVEGRPLLMSIFKSCVGQDIDALAAHFREQALGGVDFIKDDEIFFSEQFATPEQRVARFNEVATEVAEQTGRRVQYAVNLTGKTFALRDRARRLSELGAGALLLNVLAYGYDVLQELAADDQVTVPIMAHPAISGALYGSSDYGIAANILLGDLMRIAGADIAIYPSPYGSVTLAREEGQALVESLRRPNGLRVSLPAPSAGIHPGLVPLLVEDFGQDVMVNAGGGIHGHPQGATAGGRAFCAAIDAVTTGTPLCEAAKDSEALQVALATWGVAER